MLKELYNQDNLSVDELKQMLQERVRILATPTWKRQLYGLFIRPYAWNFEVAKPAADRLRYAVNRNQRTALDLLVSGTLTDDEADELTHYCMASGYNKEDNRHWWAFYEELRQHADRLPDNIRGLLDWQLRVHGW